MVRAIRVALCCLLVASLAGSVVPSTAAPPPRPLCDACGESFEATADSESVTLTVERSTATLTVHANGSAAWVVRNRLADSEGVERLRANAGLRTDVADRAMWDTEFLGANVSSAGLLTARYREQEFAERSVGGVLRSGAFTEAYGYRNFDGLGADRLVVVAPDGTRVGRTVPGATVSEDGRRTTLTEFDDGGFVTFVPADTALGRIASALAIWSLLGPVVGTNLLLYVVLPASVFGLLVAALGSGVSRFGPDRWRVGDTVGLTLAVLGVLVASLALLGGGLSLFGGAVPPAFGVGLTAAALGASLSRKSVRDRATYRRLVAGAALGVLLAAGATLAGALAFGHGVTRSLFTGLPALIPLSALFPAGYAFGRGNRRLAVSTATAGLALSVLPFASFVSPTARFGPVVALFGTTYAVVVALAGTPLLVAGTSLAASASTAESPTAPE